MEKYLKQALDIVGNQAGIRAMAEEEMVAMPKDWLEESFPPVKVHRKMAKHCPSEGSQGKFHQPEGLLSVHALRLVRTLKRRGH